MTISRRTVNKMLAVLPVAACGGHKPRSDLRIGAAAFDAGPVEDFRPLSAVRFRSQRVIIVRDDVGMMAVSTECTHQGCTVELRSDGLSCRCHGSAFTVEGDVVSGPASMPLPHFRVELVNGRIIVDPSVTVSRDDRLIV